MMQTRRSWITLATRVACLFLVSAATAHAVGAPRLSTTARQERTRVWDSSPVPLWNTNWWIVVNATPGSSPICRLNYTARFADGIADGVEPRPVTGSWEIEGGDEPTVLGRVVVRCPTRPDYERELRVRLQAEACDGSKSAWQTAKFPVPWEAAREKPADTAGPAVPTIETVTTEASSSATIDDVRAALDQAARARGGERAVGLRVVESRGDRVRFAADIVHAATPTAAATVVPTPKSTDATILGEIDMPPSRR